MRNSSINIIIMPRLLFFLVILCTVSRTSEAFVSPSASSLHTLHNNKNGVPTTRTTIHQAATAGGGGGGGGDGYDSVLNKLNQVYDGVAQKVGGSGGGGGMQQQQQQEWWNLPAATAAQLSQKAESAFQFVSDKVTSGLHLPTETTDRLAELSGAAFVPWHVAAIAAFTMGSLLLLFIGSTASVDEELLAEAPFEPGTDTYSPEKSDVFYSQRPISVLKRIVRLGLLSGGFTTGLLFDWLVLGKLLKDEEYTALKRNEPKRAKEAVELCEQLGPTFIKLGQALSIREDLIPAQYALELRKLQDAVPPFSNEEAYDILKREYEVDDLSLIFSSLTPDPVASASVGQVYRGVLATSGKEVAVKVQRPGILAEIALDLYILRLLTPIQTQLQNAANGIKTDQEDIDLAISLVDEWGRGFVAETDYRLEADNTINFEAAMRLRGLDAVCAPTVVSELVRGKVLVTEWVDGTRLDLDVSPDIPRLCGVAVNAYLTMLLDTGVLHCDPHKGNLLRTSDGKLCILDWGMTLDVPKDLQYSLLEFIAHINTEDYDAIPQDFINLGFTPEDVTPERLQNSGITEGLSFAFRQLGKGGGPKKIQERVKQEFLERYGSDLSDTELRSAARAEMLERMESQLESEGVDVKGVTNVMEEMSRRNRELFSLPPYVLYLARAFSTLEGIGLGINEDYSIVQECYPYLARRLFTDRDPRAKKALKAMLGLTDEEEEEALINGDSALALVRQAAREAEGSEHKSGLSPSKLLEMSDGFASYTAATADVDAGKGQAAAAEEFSKLFLDPKGSTLQDIFVDETAKLGDAFTRAALRAALVDNPAAKAAASVLRSRKETARIVDNVESLVATTAEDERTLATAQELRDILRPRILGAINGTTEVTIDGASSVGNVLANVDTRKLASEQLPGAAALAARLGAGLFRRAAFRTERSEVLPEATRKRLIALNNEIADALEPKSSSSNVQQPEQ